jgi:hypothetical protein
MKRPHTKTKDKNAIQKNTKKWLSNTGRNGHTYSIRESNEGGNPPKTSKRNMHS